MKWVIYDLVFALVFPFLLPGFLVRMLRRGGYRARMGDRFGFYPREITQRLAKMRDEGGAVWIHAVSVGEVQVAMQFMEEWRRVEPGVKFCFSTTSSTGWRIAERGVGPDDVLIYNPLDFPSFVKSALKLARPRALILTESEIWPCFIRRAAKEGAKIFLVNARVSDRSAPRYAAARWLFKDVFSLFTRIYAQSALDAERLYAAGAPRDIVETTGSFKFDVAHRNEAKEREMLSWIGSGKRILLGASTWPGEDEVMLRIYSALLSAGVKDAALVIAPRHFEKADAVEENIRKAGFAVSRRSRLLAAPATIENQKPKIENAAAPAAAAPVYLADTTGELMGLYGIAYAVFVGKSLCAKGSQNMIEPCLCGKPVAVGPYTSNFRPVMSDLLSANALVQLPDEAAIEKQILAWYSAPEVAAALGRRAKAAVEARIGVVPRCVRSTIAALAPATTTAISSTNHTTK